MIEIKDFTFRYRESDAPTNGNAPAARAVLRNPRLFT